MKRKVFNDMISLLFERKSTPYMKHVFHVKMIHSYMIFHDIFEPIVKVIFFILNISVNEYQIYFYRVSNMINKIKFRVIYVPSNNHGE